MSNENKVVEETTEEKETPVPTPEPKKTTTIGASGGKKVEVDADRLTEVLNLVKSQKQAIETMAGEIEILKTKSSDKPLVTKKVKEHYCFLRKLNGEVVKGFKGGVYKEFDERQKEFILYVDVILYNDKVVNKVNYLDFISNAEKVKAKIVEKKTEEKSTIEAYVNQTEPQGEFGTLVTDVMVPVESIVEEYTFEVEVEGLGKVTLNEGVINI